MSTHRLKPGHQRGVSLIELMVAMAIGLVVVGVAASSYLNVATNTQTANALAQITEDANAALSILRSQVALAGYSRPVGVQTDPLTQLQTMVRAYSGQGIPGGSNNLIHGCDSGFADAGSHELDISQIGCTGTNGSGDAIAVVYEADTGNTYPDSNQQPTDCLGRPLPVRTEAGWPAGLYLASNKFYIDRSNASTNKELYCLGNGIGATPQPIVENVTDLQILYGVANPADASKDAVAYLSASQLTSLGGTPTWSRVVSARICIEVQSAATVPGNDQSQYLNCQGQVAKVPDAKRLVRTFSTTVVLHNRI